MVSIFSEWRRVVARACITPISEDQPQKGRRLICRRSYGSAPDESSVSAKARKALLFP